jgi:hypothetical protein
MKDIAVKYAGSQVSNSPRLYITSKCYGQLSAVIFGCLFGWLFLTEAGRSMLRPYNYVDTKQRA